MYVSIVSKIKLFYICTHTHTHIHTYSSLSTALTSKLAKIWKVIHSIQTVCF